MTMFLVGAALLVIGVLALLLPPLLGRRPGQLLSRAPDASAEAAKGRGRAGLQGGLSGGLEAGNGAADAGTAGVVAANLTILREQSRQLDADYAAGLLAEPEHAAARMELARRALEESPDEQPLTSRPASRAGLPPGRRTAVLISVLLPALAAGLYFRLGTPEALDAPRSATAISEAGAEVTMAQVEAMVSTMAERLEKMPAGQADPAGWAMLARSLASLQRYPEADRAYVRAIELAPRNAQLLADRADLLVLLQDRRSAGEPSRLIEKALQLDPDNLKALALAGSAAFERQDFAAAIGHWSRARALATAGSEFANGLERSLEAARSSAGAPSQAAAPKEKLNLPKAALASGPVGPAGAAGATGATGSRGDDAGRAGKTLGANGAADAPAGNGVNAAGGAAGAAGPSGSAAKAGLGGTVSMAPALRARVQPGDTLFIFARAAEGPRMPLAILRLQAKDLPAIFTLDDSLAMSAEFKLSRFEQVLVQARISRSGNALPQPGDLTGQVGPVKPGDRAIRLTIDQVQP